MSQSPYQGAALAPGTSLEGCRIRETLGSGVLGYTYLAWDTVRMREVVVKEHLPADLAQRLASSGQVEPTPGNSDHSRVFQSSLKSFVREARQLAALVHPT